MTQRKLVTAVIATAVVAGTIAGFAVAMPSLRQGTPAPGPGMMGGAGGMMGSAFGGTGGGGAGAAGTTKPSAAQLVQVAKARSA